MNRYIARDGLMIEDIEGAINHGIDVDQAMFEALCDQIKEVLPGGTEGTYSMEVDRASFGHTYIVTFTEVTPNQATVV